MRPSHIRRTLVLAAAVSATLVATAGLAVAHAPRTADIVSAAEQYRGRYQLKLGEAHDLLAKAPATARRADV